MDAPNTPPSPGMNPPPASPSTPRRGNRGILILLVIAALLAIPVLWSMFAKDATNLRGALLSGGGTEAPPSEPFDYRMSVSPAELTVGRGDSARTTVTVTVTAGSPQEVRLGISEHPGITATFTGADRCTPSGDGASCSVDIALVTSTDITLGPVVGLMALGNGGRPGVLRDVPISLIVTQ